MPSSYHFCAYCGRSGHNEYPVRYRSDLGGHYHPDCAHMARGDDDKAEKYREKMEKRQSTPSTFTW